MDEAAGRARQILLQLIPGYQGWFVFERVLLGVEHPDRSPEQLEALKPALDRMNAWARELANGQVFAADPTAVADAAQLLEDLANHTANVVNGAAQAVTSEGRADPVVVQVLVAAAAWAAYAYEHEVRLGMMLAKAFGQPDLEDALLQQTPLAADAVRHANALFGEVRDPSRWPDGFVDRVAREWGHVPDLLRVRAAKAIELADGLRA